MKKLLLLVAMAISVFAMAGNGFGVKYTESAKGSSQLAFNLDKYAIETVVKDGKTYSTIVFAKDVTTMKKGWASLPFISSAIQLSADKNVSIDVANSEYKDIQLSYPLLPSRGAIYRNQDPTTIPYEIDPASVVDAWYPAQIVKAEAPFIFRDVRGTSIKVYPFQYNAKQNVLRVYTKVEVSVEENDTPAINPLKKQNNQIVAQADAWYKSLFINYKSNRDVTMPNNGDLHVIYTARDTEAIQPYIDWKREKGFNVSTEEVATGTNVATNVQTAYDNNNNIMFVQLVGDWEDIKCNQGGGSNAPMDPMLGCVVGTDNYPDVAIGRFSANSPEQLTIQVNKTIAYEKTPDNEGTWLKSAMHIASQEGGGSQADDSEQDKVHSQIIYDHKLDPFTYDNQYQIYEPDASAAAVTEGLNAGAGIINYTGHGSETSFGTSGFSNDDINNLENGSMLPFIFSVACVNGKFHSSGGDCFAEAWLKKDNGGAVMTLMSTINQPWAPPMRGQDYFNDILSGGYDYDNNPGNGTNTTEGRSLIGSIVLNGLVLMYEESSNASDLNTIQTWTTFGDCSLEIRTDTPAPLALSNEIILEGNDYTTTITADGNPVEGAMVCLSQDGNYSSAISNENGEVTVENNFTPGPAKLVVTAYNTQTIYQDVTIISPEGPYLVIDEVTVENDDNAAIYNQSFTTKVVIKNVGNDPATNVTLSLLPEEDSYVTLASAAEVQVGNIAADEAITLDNAYTLQAARFVPNASKVGLDFILSTPNKETTWNSRKEIKVLAPELQLEFVSVDDAAGNGNGLLDAGETALIHLMLRNVGGAEAVVGKVMASAPEGILTVNTASVDTEALSVGGELAIAFEVSVAPDAEEGSLSLFTANAVADKYVANLSSILTVGLVMEDFETGDFSAFPWTFVGNADWEIVTSDVYEGTYSASSKSIGNSQAAVMKVNVSNTSSQTISFYRKVSSESTYDKLIFYIDSEEKGSWSGEKDWEQFTYTVEPGEHELAWKYKKDVTQSSGQDKAWVDNIVMPAIGSNTFADFTANFQVVCKNEPVQFTAQADSTCTFAWTFEGATPATSTEMNPVVKYMDGGAYKVSLTINDGTTESTMVKESFMNVEDCWLAVEDMPAQAAAFRLYPNPNNGQFVIEAQAQSIVNVYNNMGALVFEGQLTEGANTLHLQDQAKGVYIIRVIAEGKATTHKVIIR